MPRHVPGRTSNSNLENTEICPMIARVHGFPVIRGEKSKQARLPTHLRSRGWSQARAGRASVLLNVQHQNPLLDADGVGPGALQEGDADDRPAHSPLLDDGAHHRPRFRARETQPTETQTPIENSRKAGIEAKTMRLFKPCLSERTRMKQRQPTSASKQNTVLRHDNSDLVVAALCCGIWCLGFD